MISFRVGIATPLPCAAFVLSQLDRMAVLRILLGTMSKRTTGIVVMHIW